MDVRRGWNSLKFGSNHRTKDKTRILTAIFLVFFLGILMGVQTLYAELARVGPVDPANGFPFWYQDQTGLAMDLCLPNMIELQNGTCLLLAGDIPDPSQPISFPGNFPEEAFWWNAEVTMDVNGGSALMLLALEAAFLNGPVAQGEQISFARLRLRIDTPGPGTFRVIYPLGEKTFDVVTGGSRAINLTVDIGFVPGDFALALTGPVGPYLLASDTPGGAPLPFVDLPGGNKYLADPTVPTAITGSPFGTNYFRIEGPNIGGPGIDFAEIDQFTLLGRVHPGPITDIVNVERATYTRDNNDAWIDVFANVISGIGTTAPELSFTGVGLPGKLMTADGSNFYGQSIAFDPTVLPASIIVANNSDHPPTLVEVALTDMVTITEASFQNGSLTVMAISSDNAVPPTLAVLGYGPMANGQLVVSGLAAPPSEVTVVSTAGGSSTAPVSTMPEPVVGPVVADDAAITDADQPVVVDVMANDPSSLGVVIRILGTPQHGTAALVACTPPSTSAICIQYSPVLYYFGADTFTYVVQDGSNQDSNVASVAITINFVNHNPVAVDDAVNVGTAASFAVDVLANDIDPDGNGTLDPASVTIIDPPTAGTASVDTATGRINYTAPDQEGTFTFTYSVSDTSIPVLTSNVATVTVTVFQPDAIDVSKAVFRTDRNQWTVVGTTLIPGPGNTVIVHLGSTLAGTIIGSAASDVTGAWKLVVKNSEILPDADNTISVESSHGAQLLAVPVKIKN